MQVLSEEENDEEAMGNPRNVEETTTSKKRKNGDDAPTERKAFTRNRCATEDNNTLAERLARYQRRNEHKWKQCKEQLEKEEKQLQRKEKQLQMEEEKRVKAMKEFDDLCLGLQNNTLTVLNQCFTKDQVKAISLALLGNKSLEQLILDLDGLKLLDVRNLCDSILQSQLKHLMFSCNAMDTNIRLYLFQTIEVSATITKLTIWDSMDIDTITCLGQALKNNLGISELEIEIESHLTDVEANALSWALQQSHLLKLSIDCYSARFVDFREKSRNRVGTAAAYSVLFEGIQQKMQSLKVLIIISFEVTLPLITLIANGLQNSTTLKELVLDQAEPLDDDELRVLCRGLTQNSSLTALRLPASFLNDDSALILAENLNQHLQLEEIILGDDDHGDNHFGPSGALALVRAVSNMPAMQTLSLHGNNDIGYDGLRMIGEELPNLRLREFDLAFYADKEVEEGDLSEDEINALEDAARDALLQGIKDNKYIWNLHIDESTFQRRDFYDTLNYYLDLNRWGRRLLTMDHGLSPTIWCYLLARAGKPKMDKDPENALSFMYLVLREQPDLVQVSRRE